MTKDISKNIVKNMQRDFVDILKTGGKIIEIKLTKEQERDGEKIKNYELEINPDIYLKNLGLVGMGSAHYARR